jgi:carbamate kinase
MWRRLWFSTVPPVQLRQRTPLDVLGADSKGWVGYVIEHEFGNAVPFDKLLAMLSTMFEVGPNGSVLGNRAKPIGTVYTVVEAKVLAEKHRWTSGQDRKFCAGCARTHSDRVDRRCRVVRALASHGFHGSQG